MFQSEWPTGHSFKSSFYAILFGSKASLVKPGWVQQNKYGVRLTVYVSSVPVFPVLPCYVVCPNLQHNNETRAFVTRLAIGPKLIVPTNAPAQAGGFSPLVRGVVRWKVKANGGRGACLGN